MLKIEKGKVPDLVCISVLVITYNHEAYIKQSLKTIVDQNGNFRLEVVVSNDCSTDGTDLVIRDFIKSYNGNAAIKYFAQDHNIGILPNLIFALNQCSGDFLAFCEGDDFWLDEHKLQKQLNLYHQHSDCSMVITNRLVIREDNSTYDELYDVFHKKKVFAVSDIIEGFIPGTQTMFAKNNKLLVDFLSAYKGLEHGDRYITYFFSLQGNIYLLLEITAAYRLTGYGAWSANNGLRKLQWKAELLEDFHHRIGLPLNNIALARTQLACWFLTIKYCVKRPHEFRNAVNRNWITKTWKKFRHMNRKKILWQILFQR